MNRFKFRAWDSIINKFLNYYSLLLSVDGCVYGVTGIHGEKFGIHQIVIQQWIGLQDKNGKDIFEGDFLKSDTIFGFVIAEVFWCINTLQFKGRYDNQKVNLFLSDTKCYEIIGNIFEHPELLENKNEQ